MDSRLTSADVARGVGRLFALHGMVILPEVPLPNGRRSDICALDTKGHIIIVEIKVSRADLHSDKKWPEYLEYCDQFYWALPAGLHADILDSEAYLPSRSGLIVADAYDAAIIRPAALHPLPPARRKAEWLRLARTAMRRHMQLLDPALMPPLTDV
jgi:hypothetical protein